MSAEGKTTYRAAPFAVDVTPPGGHPIAYGVNNKTDSPLYVRGQVIDDGYSRAVFASADFIGLSDRAYSGWRRTLARVAQTPEKNVFLHAVHQHDSIYPAPAADEILKKYGFKPNVEPGYWKRITDILEKEVERCVKPGRAGRFRKADSLAVSETRLSGLASNRRILGNDGKIRAMRWSMCDTPMRRR